jgi:DNA mismatch repair protein MutL
VRNLFYNIPARRKFLRAVRTETDHIIDVFSRVALPFPRIAFRLEDAGKTIMNLPASDQHIQRLYSLMGRKVAGAMIEVQERNHDLGISAYLAPPDLSRTRGDRLFVYVNGRNIRDRLVTKAVLEGYGQRLMKGQYPQAVIFIEIDPSKVDVNIHPTKQEVRFLSFPLLERHLARAFTPILVQNLSRKAAFFKRKPLVYLSQFGSITRQNKVRSSLLKWKSANSP